MKKKTWIILIAILVVLVAALFVVVVKLSDNRTTVVEADLSEGCPYECNYFIETDGKSGGISLSGDFAKDSWTYRISDESVINVNNKVNRDGQAVYLIKAAEFGVTTLYLENGQNRIEVQAYCNPKGKLEIMGYNYSTFLSEEEIAKEEEAALQRYRDMLENWEKNGVEE